MRGKNFILTILMFLFVSILSMAVENSTTLSDVFESLTLGGSPLVLLGKKAEKEEKEKKLISQKGLLKDEISEILKNYSEPSEEKNFLEFLLGKI